MQKRMQPNLQPHEPEVGGKNRGWSSPWMRELARRQGRSYARIGLRKLLIALSGKRMTAVHLRANGERRFDLAEIGAIARSPDPKVNAMEPVAEALSVIAGARQTLPAAELVTSVLARLRDEQKSDGSEDVTQGDVHEALALAASKGLLNLTPSERDRARRAVIAHRDAVIRYGAKLLAVAGDLEALVPQLTETRH